MLINFCETLISRIKERQAIYLETISSGNLDTFDEYKSFAGKLSGLQESERIVREMYRDMFESRNVDKGEENVEERVRLY